MLPARRRSNPQPPNHRSDAHSAEPPRPANHTVKRVHDIKTLSWSCQLMKNSKLMNFNVRMYINVS